MAETVEALLASGRATLIAGPEWLHAEASLEAELLLAQVLGTARWRLRVVANDVVAPEAVRHFGELLARRAAGEPLHYLLGQREFWSLDLQVGPGVLVPRPDTECLVEQALARIDAMRSRGAGPCRVLDLGTGSGAIAIAIAAEVTAACNPSPRPSQRTAMDVAPVDVMAVEITAVEFSPVAAGIAAANIARHAPGRVELLAGSWWAPVRGRRFEVVVSNPPYLTADDPHLPSLAFEPREALVSGIDGLECFRAILAEALAHLAPGGWLGFEHGAGQGEAVRHLMNAAGLARVATHRDLSGHERVTGGYAPG